MFTIDCISSFPRIIITFLVVSSASVLHAQSPSDAGPLRPIAIELTDSEKFAIVANRDSGTVSLVDLNAGSSIYETKIGDSISDLQKLKNDQFLATDFNKHRLVGLEFDPQSKKIVQRWSIPISRYPKRIIPDLQSNRCYVAGLWSQRLSVVDLQNPKPKLIKQIDLPFAPGAIALLPKRKKLVVAAKFSAQLAIIDAQKLTVDRVRRLPGHSIRDLFVSGERLWISCQVLNELAHSTRNDVHWGLMISNEIRSLKIDSILDPNSDLLKQSTVQAIGGEENGKGDPGRIHRDDRGREMVLIEGTHQIGYRGDVQQKFEFIDVGKKPVDLAVGEKKQIAITANMFDDSISIVDLARISSKDPTAGVRSISLRSIPAKLTTAQKGEALFFDASLSHDRWMSCGSCHVEAHTNGLRNDNFGDQSYGAPKLVKSALGRRGTQPFGWNGSTQSVDQQVENSIINTMQGVGKPAQQTIDQIAAFLKSLPPPPALAKARQDANSTGDSFRRNRSFGNGQRLFIRLNCIQCHQGEKLTTSINQDVGLTDELGVKMFNPPSLISVSQRPAYFHDGRARTLREVFEKEKHPMSRTLNAQELNDLLTYLRGL